MARHRITLGAVRRAAGFVLINFAAPIAFFWTFEVAGAKPAIALAVGIALIQSLAHFLLGIRPSPFFIVGTGFTLLLGCLDLLIRSPRFFRLEPSAQNLLVGAVFLASVAAGRPVAEWFVRGFPEKFRPRLGAGAHAYLRRVTIVWGLYLILKGLVFLWLAFRVDLGKLILLRSVIGGGTMALLIGGEIAYRKWFRKE